VTNREWLFSLTDEELSHFFSFGLKYRIPVLYGPNDIGYHYDYINIQKISLQYTNSQKGLDGWLKEEYDGRYDQ